MSTPNNLIIVCCHGIWLGGPSKGHNESEWLIADFQHGETPTFIEHIKAGIRCLSEDKSNSVLVFSGAPTRRETALSEAQSYANVAIQNDYFSLLASPVMDGEIVLEERALDSYHNILFSLTLFQTRFGGWPQKVTIISHAFKRPRVVDGHCVAIGFPLDTVSFVGIDPPGLNDKEGAMMGVTEAVGDWEDDPHGRGDKLASKRARRNVWGTWQGVFEEGIDESRKGELTTVGHGKMESLADGMRPW